MSVRPIEVQGSFPQSHKAGKIQEQLQQRGQVGQEILAQKHKEEELRKGTQVNETKEAEKSRFHQDGQGGQNSSDTNERKNEKEGKQTVKHPFKGQFIDISR